MIGGLWAPALSSADSVSSSADYQVDPAHDGALPGLSLPTPMTKQWSVQFAEDVSYPVIADGTVFVTAQADPDAGSSLFAVDQSTGKILWQHPLGGTYGWAMPTYDAGRVFTVNDDGLLSAIDATTGALVWSQQLPRQWLFTSPPTASGGVVYDGGAGDGGTLYATDEATGALLWTAGVANGDDSSPAVADGAVYVTYPENYYAFDAATGAVDWDDALGGDGGGGRTPVVADGHVYVRDWVSASRIVSTADGSLQGPLGSTLPPAVSGGIAYEMDGNELQAVSDDGLGSVAWTFTGDGTLDTSPLVTGDTAWVGASSGDLYALDETTGQLLWSTDVGAPIEAPNEHGPGSFAGLGAGNGSLIVPASNSLVDYAPTGAIALPLSSVAPTIDATASALVGQTLTATAGTWTNAPASYAYQWLDCDSTGANCTSIPGATSSSYTLTANDIGSTIEVSVTATNATGTGLPALSSPSPIVQAPVSLIAPAVVTAPALGGSATVGGTLTATSGSWSGTAPLSYAYQWLSCTTGCEAISGATQPTLPVTSADTGDELEVVVAASNAAGTAIAVSAPSAAVPVSSSTPTTGGAPTSATSGGTTSGGVAPNGGMPSPTPTAPGAAGVTPPAASTAAAVPATSTATLAGQTDTRLAAARLASHRGVTLRITVTAPGRLVVAWYARRATRRPTMIASGQLAFTGAGRRSLMLRLTPRGLRLLRTLHGSLPVVSLAEYTPEQGHAVVAMSHFVLRRR